MNLQLTEILPRIYHLYMESAYDLAMHFVRVQEYYESPKFRGKIFTLVDFMEWYSREHGEGAFTYPSDWSGFNVPSTVLLEVYGRAGAIPDPNKYDELMSLLTNRIDTACDRKPFYLIGTSERRKGDEETLNHELAHGLYFTDSTYRKGVQELLRETQEKRGRDVLEKSFTALKKMGYHPSIVDDELQAYCATGPCEELEGILTEKIRTPFIDFFGGYMNKVRRGA